MKQIPAVRRPLLMTALASSLLFIPGLGVAGNVGVAGKVSSLGYGVEVDYVLSDKFSVRAQYNQFDYDDTFEEDDIEYEGTLDLKSIGVLLDWHPFGGAFRVSAGGFNVDNEMRGLSTDEGTYEIGDNTYTVGPGDDLRATALIELGDGFMPYAGIGWGHSPANQGGLLLSFDIGVLFQGSPSVDLEVSGTANNGLVDFSTDPTVQADVQREEDNMEDDLKDFDLYPVVSFGIGWRF